MKDLIKDLLRGVLIRENSFNKSSIKSTHWFKTFEKLYPKWDIDFIGKNRLSIIENMVEAVKKYLNDRPSGGDIDNWVYNIKSMLDFLESDGLNVEDVRDIKNYNIDIIQKGIDDNPKILEYMYSDRGLTDDIMNELGYDNCVAYIKKELGASYNPSQIHKTSVYPKLKFKDTDDDNDKNVKSLMLTLFIRYISRHIPSDFKIDWDSNKIYDWIRGKAYEFIYNYAMKYK